MSELTIILLGWVFSKKTPVKNAILGIREVEGRTETCLKETRIVGEQQRRVTVVDTPGWWKYFSANLVPSTVKSELMKALDGKKGQAKSDPSAKDCPQDQASSSPAFLLMVPVDTSFTNEQRKIIEDNMKPLGEQVWENIIVVFTRGNWLGDYSIEKHIETEGDALVWLVEKCGNRYFVFDDEKEEDGIDSQATELLDKVEEMLKKKTSRGPSFQTLKKAEDEDHMKAGVSEGEVDEDLKKMVEVLYRVWGWRSWETEEVRRRFEKRLIPRGNQSLEVPLQMSGDAPGHKLIRLKTYHNREEMEEVLRDQTCGKSLEEVMKIALQIYFRKDCGAFDIVSIISEENTFKPEWKQLFEREWSRREVRLMEDVAQRCFSSKDTDDAFSSDLSEPEPKKMKVIIEKVSAWLKSHEDVSEASKVPGFVPEEWNSDPGLQGN